MDPVSGGFVSVSPAWLASREQADAQARATDLVERVNDLLPAGDRVVVHDLGSGTGSMGRWLAPRLTGRQHWVLYDRDATLLAIAAANLPVATTAATRLDVADGPASAAITAADGAAVTVQTRQRDVTRLDSGDLEGASLITASALLDMLTADELERFVATCAGARCPVLVTLSVTGRVDVSPIDPLDELVSSAFNQHQRRTTRGGHLLGPDAVRVAVEAFARHGADVLVRPSPWRLGAGQAALAAEWFSGWVGPACQQRPELINPSTGYIRRRMAEASAGRLGVTVHHLDLLAWPR